MSEDPDDPNPQVEVSPTASVPFVFDEPAEEGVPRDPFAPGVSASQEEISRERERQPSEMEGRTPRRHLVQLN